MRKKKDPLTWRAALKKFHNEAKEVNKQEKKHERIYSGAISYIKSAKKERQRGPRTQCKNDWKSATNKGLINTTRARKETKVEKAKKKPQRKDAIVHMEIINHKPYRKDKGTEDMKHDQQPIIK